MKDIGAMTDVEFLRHMNDTYFPPFPWALDFCRALRDRPWWARLLVRIAFGRYAYREFIGMQNAFIGVGYSPFFDYGIETCDYHNDAVPLDWWNERKHLPMKGA